MAIDEEKRSQVLRYHFVEKWRVGTIATQLGIHHSTVERILAQAGQPKSQRARRPSKVDPYTPMIQEMLTQYPGLTAERLLGMARERGYTGSSSLFRAHVACLRPTRPKEAFLRLKTLPGEQMQMDWGDFGRVQVGRAQRRLYAFVLVLSWSRRIDLQFYYHQDMSAFLHGHVSAFTRLGGVAREVLYDNLRSAVLERHGDAIRYHPSLLQLAGHYRFEPRACAPRRGNEKGRVERSIRYIRDAFFAGRRYTDLDDLNAQAQDWCTGISQQRPWPEDTQRTVAQAWAEERSQLLALPDDPLATAEQREVRVGKTPYVRFDSNDYSVPATLVGQTLVLEASETRVRLVQGDAVVAEHPRCWSRAETQENPEHVKDLTAWKYQARSHRAQDRLAQSVPSSHAFLQQAAERGTPLGRLRQQLIGLLDDYGAQELDIAISEALSNGVPHPNAVAQVLERRREARQRPPVIPVALPDRPELRNISVRQPSLADYDRVATEPHTPEDPQ